jgi:hypothetical protein
MPVPCKEIYSRNNEDCVIVNSVTRIDKKNKALLATRAWLTWAVQILMMLPAMLFALIFEPQGWGIFNLDAALTGFALTVILITGFRLVLATPRGIKKELERNGVKDIHQTEYGWIGRVDGYGVRARCREPLFAFDGITGGAPRFLGPRALDRSVPRIMDPTAIFEDGGLVIWKPQARDSLENEGDEIPEERIVGECALGAWMTRVEAQSAVRKCIKWVFSGVGERPWRGTEFDSDSLVGDEKGLSSVCFKMILAIIAIFAVALVVVFLDL